MTPGFDAGAVPDTVTRDRVGIYLGVPPMLGNPRLRRRAATGTSGEP